MGQMIEALMIWTAIGLITLYIAANHFHLGIFDKLPPLKRGVNPSNFSAVVIFGVIFLLLIKFYHFVIFSGYFFAQN
jgi:hypothetical protein